MDTIHDFVQLVFSDSTLHACLHRFCLGLDVFLDNLFDVGLNPFQFDDGPQVHQEAQDGDPGSYCLQ
jgi:hypothetical protein